MNERQVSQSYREALVQISPTTEKKEEKGNQGYWKEWSMKEREKKRKREVEKEMTEIDNPFNIIGDKLLLNFGMKFQR